MLEESSLPKKVIKSVALLVLLVIKTLHAAFTKKVKTVLNRELETKFVTQRTYKVQTTFPH